MVYELKFKPHPDTDPDWLQRKATLYHKIYIRRGVLGKVLAPLLEERLAYQILGSGRFGVEGSISEYETALARGQELNIKGPKTPLDAILDAHHVALEILNSADEAA